MSKAGSIADSGIARPSLKERYAVLVIIGFVLAICVLTATRSPTVWIDEVMHIDPGVTLALDGSFVTTAWWQSRVEPFGSYSPLFPLCLAAWLKIFGVGMLAVRSFPIVLGCLSAFLFWRFLSVSGLVVSPAIRVVTTGAMLCGYGFSFLYRCARGDILGVVILLGALNFLCARPRKLCFGGIFVSGFLLPSAGIAHSMVGAIICGVAALSFRREAILPILAFGIGGILGVAALFLGLSSAGTLHNYLSVTTSHFAIPLGAPGLMDPSLALVFACGVFAAFLSRHWRCLRDKYAVAALALCVLGPFSLWKLSHFPVYYNWVVFLPALFWTARTLDLSETGGRATKGLLIILLASGIPGLVARTGVSVLEWRARDYDKVRSFVAAQAKSNDVILADFPCYYAVKGKFGLIFFPTIWPSLSSDDRRRATLAIIHEKQVPSVREYFGPGWEVVGKMNPSRDEAKFRAALYQLVALRRTPDGTGFTARAAESKRLN